MRRPGGGAGWPGMGLARRRNFAMLLVVTAAFAAITVRLADIQVLSPGGYARRATSQDTRTTVLPALRGSILDRNGQALALTEPRYDIIADPYQITDPAGEAGRLSLLLHLPAGVLTSDLQRHTGYVELTRSASTTTAEEIMKLALPGIVTRRSARRYYPAGPLASPVIGTVDAAGLGAAGLEYQYNKILTGTPGRLVQRVDPQGQAIAGGTIEDQPAVMGDDLVLTLDEPLQYQTEQALAQALVASHGKRGVAMVMDTRTGGLLAVADLSMPTGKGPSTPALPVTIGPGGRILPPGSKTTVAQPVESPAADAFTTVYEPGSVEKLVTVTAALATNTVTPDEYFTIPNAYPVDGIPIHDAENHGMERLSVTGIVAQSSNIGAAEIVGRLGAPNLYSYIHAYGLGAPTPVHFPGESPGLIPALSTVSPVTLATMAYGEGMAVTAAQMITAYNTVANGGVYVAPHLVKSVIGPHGNAHPVPVPKPHRVVSSSVAAEMTAILEQVVASGTGTAAKVPPYAVAGKTGTAQYHGPTGYVAGRTVASFAGFAPAQHPAVTVMVVIDDTPDYGAQASAPAFATITRDALTDLRIPADGPQPPSELLALPQPLTQPAG